LNHLFERQLQLLEVQQIPLSHFDVPISMFAPSTKQPRAKATSN
jgi:hypothetical protein